MDGPEVLRKKLLINAQAICSRLRKFSSKALSIEFLASLLALAIELVGFQIRNNKSQPHTKQHLNSLRIPQHLQCPKFLKS